MNADTQTRLFTLIYPTKADHRSSENGRRHIFTGDPATVQTKAHRIAGQDERITVAVDITGIHTDRVQSGDDLGISIQNLRAMVDQDTSQRSVGAHILSAAIEFALADRLHVHAVFLENLIVAVVAHLVIFLDLSHESIHIDSGFFRQLFLGVGFANRFVTFGNILIPSGVKLVVQIMRMDMRKDIRTVSFVAIQKRRVKNGKTNHTGLCCQGISRKRGVSDLVFRHKPFAIPVDPQAGLAKAPSK